MSRGKTNDPKFSDLQCKSFKKRYGCDKQHAYYTLEHGIRFYFHKGEEQPAKMLKSAMDEMNRHLLKATQQISKDQKAALWFYLQSLLTTAISFGEECKTIKYVPLLNEYVPKLLKWGLIGDPRKERIFREAYSRWEKENAGLTAKRGYTFGAAVQETLNKYPKVLAQERDQINWAQDFSTWRKKTKRTNSQS